MGIMNEIDGLTQKEEKLFQNGAAANIETLKEKYAKSAGKVYVVKHVVQVDDETEAEYDFLFQKPKPAAYDRYVKTMSSSVSKASRAFVLDNIVDEQRDELSDALEEYPAMAITYAEKLLKMLGLGDMTSVKKL